MLVDVMFGKEVFEDRNATVQVFACPSMLYNSFDNELHIAGASHKDAIPLTRHSSRGKIHAYADGNAYRDDLGGWTQSTFDVPENFILKIFAQSSPGFGKARKQASQYIRVREKAAYRELRVKLTEHHKARFMYATIAGRFDLITEKEARARGVNVSPFAAGQFQKSHIDFLFKDIVKEEAIEEVPEIQEKVIKRKTGRKLVARKVKSVRRFDMED